MAITATAVRITLRATWMSQTMITRMYYTPVGAAWLTADALAGAQAWWDNVKGAWRGLISSGGGAVFTSVLFEEIGGSLGFAEYAIPTAERVGTRSTAGLTQALPPFCAVGVRLTVATRVTRPGQKRFYGMFEEDQAEGVVSVGFNTLIDALAPKYSTQLTLGAPVATGNLTPVILRLAPDGVTIDAIQNVAGYVKNPNVTTQNSRKIGRGI